MSDPIFNSLLTHRATIWRNTPTLDGVGGEAAHWGTVTGTVVCLVQPTPLAQSAIAKLQLKCKPETDVLDEDRVSDVRLASGTPHPLYGNKLYSVTSAVDVSGQAHHTLVNLVELSGGN